VDVPLGETKNSEALTGTVHEDQLVRHVGYGLNGGANTLRVSTEIGVEGAQDDIPMVCRPLLVKAEEVAAVVRKKNTAFRHCERQNLGIGHCGIRPSSVQRGDDVMAKSLQLRDSLSWDILVRVEMGHPLRGFVLLNLRLDFLGMRTRVGPGVHEVLGAQMRVGSRQGLLAGTQASGLLEKPNRNASSNQTWLAAAHVRPGVDTWKVREPPT
jgi:hypothetical protein